MQSIAPEDFDSFAGALNAGAQRLAGRRDALEALAENHQVLVYSYGAKGRDLARQLRGKGIDCLIADRSAEARQHAEQEGFATTVDLPSDRPLIVAAGQHQSELLAQLRPPVVSWADAMYAFDLKHLHLPIRRLVDGLPSRADKLFAVYRQLDESSRRSFLALVQYRASLEVRFIAAARLPLASMWIPPQPVSIHSFCDVGAFDGDSLEAIKMACPSLQTALCIEPNPELRNAIEARAQRLGIHTTIFTGAAWNQQTRLHFRESNAISGMLSVEEQSQSGIPADRLDHLAADRQFDYIKFDIEGAEKQALDGARQQLRQARCIAIAAYHLPEDLIDLHAQATEILATSTKQWDICFRHYSETFDDSIYYCIAQS